VSSECCVLQCAAGKFDCSAAAVVALPSAAAATGSRCSSTGYITGLPLQQSLFTVLISCHLNCISYWHAYINLISGLRMLLGINWHQHVRNDEVRRLTKQPYLSAIVQSRRLSLFGHIARIPDETDAKQILTASPAGN